MAASIASLFLRKRHACQLPHTAQVLSAARCRMDLPKACFTQLGPPAQAACMYESGVTVMMYTVCVFYVCVHTIHCQTRTAATITEHIKHRARDVANGHLSAAGAKAFEGDARDMARMVARLGLDEPRTRTVARWAGISTRSGSARQGSCDNG